MCDCRLIKSEWRDVEGCLLMNAICGERAFDRVDCLSMRENDLDRQMIAEIGLRRLLALSFQGMCGCCEPVDV